MKKEVFTAEILSNELLSGRIFRMEIAAGRAAEAAAPGQFINYYPDADRLILPRPISISDADPDRGVLVIVYEVVGRGTAEMAAKKAGDSARISVPLGRGFDLSVLGNLRRNTTAAGHRDAFRSGAASRKSAEPARNMHFGEPAGPVLVGGGIGIAPMVFLARRLRDLGWQSRVIAGFRRDPVLIHEFERLDCPVMVTTEEPDPGTYVGQVTDCMEFHQVQSRFWFTCGPRPMLEAVSRYVYGQDSEAHLQVSMESRMGCGYGVCVGCVIDVQETGADGIRRIVKKKVCSDGPVFDGREVVWS